MVKVLENKIIDLDVLPGQAQIDLQRQIRSQIQNQAKGTAEQFDGATGGLEAGQVRITREMLPDGMSEEQKEQAKGIVGTVVDGGGNVIGGLAGTVGGVLKGVGDTGANVVYDLGSGLGGVGVGLAGGLKDVATAPFTGNTNTANTPESVKAQDEAVGEKKAGPRKIELRSGQT